MIKISMKIIIRIVLFLSILLLLLGSFQHYTTHASRIVKTSTDQSNRFLLKSISALVREELLRGNIYLASSKIKFLMKEENIERLKIKIINSLGDEVFKLGKCKEIEKK